MALTFDPDIVSESSRGQKMTRQRGGSVVTLACMTGGYTQIFRALRVDVEEVTIRQFDLADLDDYLAAVAELTPTDAFYVDWVVPDVAVRVANCKKRMTALLNPDQDKAAMLPQLGVWVGGRCVGVQDVVWSAQTVACRTFTTGSWLIPSARGQNVGTKSRTGVVAMCFELGFVEGYTSAYHDNAASLRVSEKVGYQPNGTVIDARSVPLTGEVGKPSRVLKSKITPETLINNYDVKTTGLEPVRTHLGL